jgi:hypothetical protein
MSKSTYPLKLPTSVKNAAAELAKLDGVSLNQFIAAAVAEKVGTIRTETATTLTLNPTEGSPFDIAIADIAKRDTAPSSMPEIYGAILTKAELRNVVEFMVRQRAKPPVVGQEIPRALRDTRADYEKRAAEKSAQ